MTSLQDALKQSLVEKGVPVKTKFKGTNGHAANEALSVAAKTVPVPPTTKKFSFASLKVPKLGTLVKTEEEIEAKRAENAAEQAEFEAFKDEDRRGHVRRSRAVASA